MTEGEFITMNWLLGLITTIVCLGLAMWRRSALARPTFILGALLLAFVGWPSIALGEWVFAESRAPAEFLAVVWGSQLALIAGGHLVSRGRFDGILASAMCRMPDLPSRKSYRVPVATLVVLSVLCVAVYLGQVGLSNTGLYTLATRPELTNEVRERALKLASPLAAASFFLMYSVTAPLLAGGCGTTIVDAAKQRKWLGATAAAMGLLVLALVVALPGMRSAAVFMLFSAGAAAAYRRGCRSLLALAGLGLVLSGCAVGLLYVGIALRTGIALSFAGLAETLVGGLGVLDRLFETPLHVGVAWMDYAQIRGQFGANAVRPIALLLGNTPVEAAAVIGREYFYRGLESVRATTSFPFAYYSYFGLPGVATGVAIMLFVDWFAAALYRRLSGWGLTATLGAVAGSLLHGVECELGVLVNTHGLVWIIALGALMLSPVGRKAATRVGGASPC